MATNNGNHDPESEERMETNRSDGTKRRTLLKSVGGTATGLLAQRVLSSVAAANNGIEVSPAEFKEAVDRYNSVPAANEAIRKHGQELLKVLADMGYLPNESNSMFKINEILDIHDYVDANEGVMVTATVYDGELTSEILIRRRSQGHKIVLSIQPEADRSYAFVNPTSGDRTTMIDPSNRNGAGEVESAVCYWSNVCARTGCGKNYCTCGVRKVTCCDNGTCGFGDTTAVCDPDDPNVECYHSCCIACNSC